MRHAPAPSQRPSRPQVDGASVTQLAGVRGGSPAALSAHVPTAPGASQRAQPLVHAVLQQTPSTQNPLLHAPADTHDCPSGSGVTNGP